MTISLNRTDLADALKALRAVAGTRNVLPVLSNVALDARDGALTLSATSLEAWGKRTLPYSGDGLDSTTVNAKAFADYVGNLSGSKITLTLDGNKLRVTDGKHKVSLPTIDRDEFPVFPVTDGPSFSIDSDVLGRVLSRTVPFAATDQARPILTGVSVRIGAGVARFAAADNYRVGVVTLPLDADDAEVVLPAAALALVPKLVQGDVLTVTVGSGAVVFSDNFSELTTRVIEGQYPNLDGVLPKEAKGAVLFDKEDFAEAVKLAALADGTITRFASTENGLHISAKGDSEFESTIDATITYEGEASFSLNSKFAAGIVGVFSDSSQLEVLYGGSALAPVEVRDPEDASFRCVLMPVRTAGAA